MKTPSAFFIGQPGKALPHSENLCSPVVTRGFDANTMFLHHYTLCEVVDRKAGRISSRSAPEKPVAQTPPGFAPDLPQRQRGNEEARRVRASRRVWATGTVPSACHRPAAASLACQPDSRHRGQSKPNAVRLAELVRCCPQSPAVSCQAAFDFHPARSSHALRSGRVTGNPTASNTSPFILILRLFQGEVKPFESRMLKAFESISSTLKTYCAKFSSGQGVQNRFQGGAL